MSPWTPEGEPVGKGTRPVTLPRPGHADLAGALKFGLDDVRDALERASARLWNPDPIAHDEIRAALDALIEG